MMSKNTNSKVDYFEALKKLINVRDTEENRKVAEAMMPLKDILPNFLESVKASINNDLTKEEKEQITALNGKAKDFSEKAKSLREDAKSLINQAKALEYQVESINAEIAKVYENAGITYTITKRAKKGITAEMTEEELAEYKRAKWRAYYAKKKAERETSENDEMSTEDIEK